MYSYQGEKLQIERFYEDRSIPYFLDWVVDQNNHLQRRVADLWNQPDQRARKRRAWAGDSRNGDVGRSGSFMLCETIDNSTEEEDIEERL